MKLLIINPNTSVETTERLALVAGHVASRGTAIEAVTAPRGVRTIKTPQSSERAGKVVLDVLASRAHTTDAAIIAAFSDPGLRGARAAHPFPVVGIGEAAMLEAAKLGRRFSIVTMGRPMLDQLGERAHEYGVGHKLASVRIVPWTVLGGQPSDFETLRDTCRDAIRCDGADVIIIGGGPLAGISEALSDSVDRPVLDGTVCAVRLAEHLFHRGTPC